MEQIGTYRAILAGGPILTYGERPIYGIRTIGLPLVKRDVNQVLVKCHGCSNGKGWHDALVWINIDRVDVTITKEGITTQWPASSST